MPLSLAQLLFLAGGAKPQLDIPGLPIPFNNDTGDPAGGRGPAGGQRGGRMPPGPGWNRGDFGPDTTGSGVTTPGQRRKRDAQVRQDYRKYLADALIQHMQTGGVDTPFGYRPGALPPVKGKPIARDHHLAVLLNAIASHAQTRLNG